MSKIGFGRVPFLSKDSRVESIFLAFSIFWKTPTFLGLSTPFFIFKASDVCH